MPNIGIIRAKIEFLHKISLILPKFERDASDFKEEKNRKEKSKCYL